MSELEFQFQHFVIVRVNVRMPGGWKRPAGDGVSGVAHPEWVKIRMEAFRRYCYASLVNQRCQNFELLVLFDDETTDRKLLEGFDRMTPIFFDPEPSWKIQVQHILEDHLKPNTGWVMTTRIDSDDAYRNDYIGEMQRLALENRTGVLYAPTGYVYHVDNKRLRWVSREGWYTGFLTRIERTDDRIRTAYAPGMHGWRGISKEEVDANTVLFDHPMWVQVIHGKNVATGGGIDRRYMTEVPLNRLRRFGIVL